MKKEEILVNWSTETLDDCKTRVTNMSVFLLEFIGRLEKTLNVTEPLEYEKDQYENGKIHIKTSSLGHIVINLGPHRIIVGLYNSSSCSFSARLHIDPTDLTYSISYYDSRILREIVSVVKDTIYELKKYRNEEL